MTRRTQLIAGAAVLILLAASAVALFLLKKKGPEKPEKKEALQVLSNSPSGDEVPINVDGITVMFDRSVVPLTTLDEGRSRSIPLEMTPSVDGKFFWLGTHGFIFRPTRFLDPATTYRIGLPAGIQSVDGQKLAQEVSWEFSTIRPRILFWSPGSGGLLLPKSRKLAVSFNVAMNKGEVEKALSVTHEETGQILLAKKKFTWSEGDHILTVEFLEALPWGSRYKVEIPKEVHAAKGNLTMTQKVSTTFSTPESVLRLEKVTYYDYESYQTVTLAPGEDSEVSLGTSICYHFSQAVPPDSFSKAFHVESGTPDGKKPNADLYHRSSNTIQCTYFLDDYHHTYRFSIDPTKVVAESGARMGEKKGDTYVVHTPHAQPELTSTLTKNILSEKGPIRIPYRAINVRNPKVHVYAMSTKQYDESIDDLPLEGPLCHQVTGAKECVEESPPVSESVGSKGINLPFDKETKTIDQERMPPLFTEEIVLPNPSPDLPTPFTVDLSASEKGKGLKPGVYLLEMTGESLVPNEEKPGTILTMIQVTPLAIAIKREVDHLLVWVTEIEEGTPRPQLPMTVSARFYKWDVAERRSWQTTTNDQGVAIIGLDPQSYDSACVEVGEPAALSCEDDHSITPNYWRGTLRPGPHFFAYLYTDRPIYRPGQTVHFSSFIRQVKEGRYFLPPDQTAYTVTIIDPLGGELLKEENRKAEGGGLLSGKIELEDADDTPTGPYEIRLTVEGQSFTKKFYVAAYRKPSFKVDLKAEKDEVISRETLRAELTGSYFFGAPLRKAKAHWSIMTSTHIFSPEGFETFSFVDDDLLYKNGAWNYGEYEGGGYSSGYEYDTVASSRSTEDSDQWDDPKGQGATRPPSQLFEDPKSNKVSAIPVRLDEEGLLSITYKPDLKKYPTSQVLTVESSVQDPSYQEVSTAEEVIVHKASYYLGIKPEKWTYGERETARFDLVSLDTQGKPVGRGRYEATLFRREYNTTQKKDSSGYWIYEFEKKDIKIDSFSGKTDGEGRARITTKLPQGGTYRLVVQGRDSKKNLFQAASEIYAWGEGYVPWKLDQPERLKLVPDKESYKVGETAKVLIQSLVPVTKALMTLERGRLLEYRVVELGGNASHLEIPVTEGMIPNLYVSLVAHVPRGEGHPPMLFSGETELAIDPESKRLQIAIETDRPGKNEDPPIYRPGEEVKVTVRTTDPSGKPEKAYLAVSVADESVLRLLDYKLPDLIRKFFFRRESGVITSSSLLSLKAGDGGGLASGQKRRIFKDTAHFEARLETDEKGEAAFQFKLPDDLTTWVIEAVAISNSKRLEEFDAGRRQTELDSDLLLSDQTFVGSNRSKLMTTLPVLVRPALPRFAAWGDQIVGRIIANNQNPDPVEGVLHVTVSGDGLLEKDQTSWEKPFSLKGKSEGAYQVPLRIFPGKSGKLIFSAEARNKAGDPFDAVEISLPVQDRYQPEIVATSGMTQKEELEQIDIPDAITGEMGGLSLSLKASLGLAIASPLRRLIYFPYGCSEQKTASLLALLMVRGFSHDFGEKFEKLEGLDEKIKTIIEDLFKNHQDITGGLKYWPESRRPDFYASVQGLWALNLAKRTGVEVPTDRIAGLRDFIRRGLKSFERKLSFDDKAFAIWVLTEEGSGWEEEIVAHEILGNVTTLTVPGLSYTLMAIQKVKDPSLARDGVKTLVNRLKTLARHEPRHVLWEGPAHFWWGSSRKNTALAALALFKNNPEDPLVARALAYLLNQKKIKECFCTQDDLTLSYLAFEYAKGMKEEKTDFKATVAAGDRLLADASFDLKHILDVVTKEIPMKEIKELPRPTDLNVKKSGDGTLYYDLVLKYYLPPELSPTREEGLIVSREYYELEDTKEEEPLTELEVGRNYKGHIVLVVPQEMNYIVVQDNLPAGLEPIDMTLATTSRAAQTMAESGGEYEEEQPLPRGPLYDDVIEEIDYGMNYGFRHQEIRDDSILWSDEYVPPGTYHIRYPVRATTAGKFLMPGATAFEFYEPEIFGRSRTREIEIRSEK